MERVTENFVWRDVGGRKSKKKKEKRKKIINNVNKKPQKMLRERTKMSNDKQGNC